MNQAKVAIVGGGIVGLAVAHRLLESYPGTTVTVLEKESTCASHQTGHNSGVLHSGIYYRPGSLKAQNCRAGKQAMERFCAEHDIAHEICGKVIVALSDDELPAMERIHERGVANGVTCERIDTARLHELEPHAAGVAALHVPEAGIVNYVAVCDKLVDLIGERGGRIVTGAKLTAAHVASNAVTLVTTAGDFEADYAVTCAGLYGDRVAALTGVFPAAKIIPFRGEYYELLPQATHLCRNLIYPVPDPSFPFLGVHFTRMIGGGVECGPNAVLALAREGYRKTDVNLRELGEALSYPGLLKLSARYWRTGLGEMWRSVSKQAFVAALQRLVPEIRAEHLEPAPAGVRAQAVARDGRMLDDFLIQESARVVNVISAPSPAATASLNIGRLVVDKLAAKF